MVGNSPLGSKILGFLEFLVNRHMMVTRLSSLYTVRFYPQVITLHSFLLQAEWPRTILLWITVHILNFSDSVLDLASNTNETTNFMVKGHFSKTKSFPVTQGTHRILWDQKFHYHIYNCQPKVRLVYNTCCNINLPYVSRSYKLAHSFRFCRRISIHKFLISELALLT